MTMPTLSQAMRTWLPRYAGRAILDWGLRESPADGTGRVWGMRVHEKSPINKPLLDDLKWSLVSRPRRSPPQSAYGRPIDLTKSKEG